MPRLRSQGFIVFLIVLLLTSLATIAVAGDNHTTSLKTINKKIAHVKADLDKAKKKRSHLEHLLKSVEVSLGKTAKSLSHTQTQLHQQKTILKKLHKKARHYQHKLKKQQHLLSKQLQSAYILGRQPYLKLLLDQHQTAQTSRLLTYYEYISQRHIKTIKSLTSTLEKLDHTEQALHQHTQKLKKLQHQQQQDQRKLTQKRNERRDVISKINSDISTKHQKLLQLESNKKQLEDTIRQIDREARSQAAEVKDFYRLRHHLPWPTNGTVLDYFGEQIQHSELHWSGVLIKAPKGQAVHAIANGKVVFAKWLAGYGLLIIVNHGHGYMSLYGRNHSIRVKVGDVVLKGEKIATVGQSGGHSKPSLYFGLRHKGKALNPATWCQKTSHIIKQ